MKMPPGPDWTTYATKLEASAKKMSELMLLKDFDKATNYLGEIQECVNKLAEWIVACERINR